MELIVFVSSSEEASPFAELYNDCSFVAKDRSYKLSTQAPIFTNKLYSLLYF